MTVVATAPQPPPGASDAVTFDSLYSECAQPIYNFVLRLVHDPDQAQDVCQEVWTKAYRGLHTVREAAATRGWLYRIARHATIDAARRRAASPPNLELGFDPPAREDGPLEVVLRDERLRLVWQTLGALSERQQTALYLKEIDGRCYREIGEVLDCTESAVEALLVRARRTFAARYEGLSADRTARCAQARRVMSIWIDGEGTPVQRKALLAHLGECVDCRDAASISERHLAARAAIPLLSLPTMLPFDPGSAFLPVSDGARTLLSRVAELLTAKAAGAALAVTASGAIAVTTLVTPVAVSMLPSGTLASSIGGIDVTETSPNRSGQITSTTMSELIDTAPNVAPDARAELQGRAELIIGPISLGATATVDEMLDVTKAIDMAGGLASVSPIDVDISADAAQTATAPVFGTVAVPPLPIAADALPTVIEPPQHAPVTDAPLPIPSATPALRLAPPLGR